MITVNNEEFSVCRQAFASIHGFGLGKVDKIIKDRKKYPTGAAPDLRGKGPSANKITGIRLDLVHQHIQSLAVTSSHYSRAHSPHHRFLPAELTIRKLWEKYVEWVIDCHPGVETVNYQFYSNVFTTSYNIDLMKYSVASINGLKLTSMKASRNWSSMLTTVQGKIRIYI